MNSENIKELADKINTLDPAAKTMVMRYLSVLETIQKQRNKEK